MLDITLSELINVLGNPTRTTGHQYYFRCPACAQSGGDTHCDNLLFNDRKGVLKCFACDDGAKETLKLINSNRSKDNFQYKEQPIERKPKKEWWSENIDNLYQYMCEANDEMPNYVKKWLWENYGIDTDTIDDCCIGFDNKPNMVAIGSSVVFPMISLKRDILVGFELREMGPNKVIRHTLDAPSGLCAIWGRTSARHLIICEGFKDAYCMKQLLFTLVEEQVANSFLICTPAHGCRDIIKNITDAPLAQFAGCYLMLDNDEAGDKVTKEVLKEYPFFKDKRYILHGYKDVCDYWRSICYN